MRVKNFGNSALGAQWRRVLRGDRRGSAVIEFAVVAPLLLLLVLMLIQMGQLVNVAQIVANAAREGARNAARNTTTNTSQVVTAITNYMAQMFEGYRYAPGSTDLAVTVTATNPATSNTVTIAGGDLLPVPRGSAMSVRVQFNFNAVTWTPAFKGGSGNIALPWYVQNIVLQATSVMRRD